MCCPEFKYLNRIDCKSFAIKDGENCIPRADVPTGEERL